MYFLYDSWYAKYIQNMNGQCRSTEQPTPLGTVNKPAALTQVTQEFPEPRVMSGCWTHFTAQMPKAVTYKWA